MTDEVEQVRFRQAILTAVADPDMAKILEWATFRCKSVNEVIKETDIPHSTAYRKIKWMLDEGLLFTERIEITQDGKKTSLIRSTIRSINITYEIGKITVKIEKNVDVIQKRAERLFSLDSD
jgi:hypothetical protein